MNTLAPSLSLADTYRMLYELLDHRERKRAAILLTLLILVALSEALGVASILPFIAVLATPDVIHTNKVLSSLYERFEFQSDHSFLLALGLAFLAILLGSLVLRSIGIWAQLRFSHNRQLAWSVRLVEGYLRQPYEWFLNQHSAELATSVLALVHQAVTGVLLPSIQLIAQILVSVCLVCLLLIVDPALAMGATATIAGGFAAFSRGFRSLLRFSGEKRQQANSLQFKIVQEAFGGIKEVKASGLELVFVRRFESPTRTVADSQISLGLVSQLPVIAMQGLLFGGMLLVLLYLMASHGGFARALPVIALFAFAGYRLMPAIQSVYRDISQVRYSRPSLDTLHSDLTRIRTQTAKFFGDHDNQRLRLRQCLTLRDVSYRYPGSTTLALDRVSLSAPAFQKIGLVGLTGSGKTTAVDIILGLLRPESGALIVDGQAISEETARSWQLSIGYVPQTIFLADDTIASNIAFGLSSNAINMAEVEHAARIANIHEFVMSLPSGYETRVGERGVRLSGGERQRIGIARALYKDPDLVIMDEATSALDNLTENAVMEAVQNLGGLKTIILIAHRLTTVRSCEQIYVLEQGKVVAQGTYDELLTSSEKFRALAEGVTDARKDV